MGVYTNVYVSEAAIPPIIAIRFCTLLNICLNPCFTFSASRLRAAVCRISAHSCPSYSSLAFALLSFFLSQSTTKLSVKAWSENNVFF